MPIRESLMKERVALAASANFAADASDEVRMPLIVIRSSVYPLGRYRDERSPWSAPAPRTSTMRFAT